MNAKVSAVCARVMLVASPQLQHSTKLEPNSEHPKLGLRCAGESVVATNKSGKVKHGTVGPPAGVNGSPAVHQSGHRGLVVYDTNRQDA
jgi:hypothetical protein